MLRTRVLTALVLVPSFLAALFILPERGWAAFCALVVATAASEWQGLVKAQPRPGLLYPFVTGGIFYGLSCLAIPASWLAGVFAASASFWLLVTPCWLARKWRLDGAGKLGLALGWGLLLPAGLAMQYLRGDGWLLLAVMMIAWVADTFAYFFGRLFGRHKLAPAISPGKSWEGALGGMLAVCVYCWLLPKPFEFFPGTPAASGLMQQTVWMLGGVLLTVVSIQGDLLESLFKRQAGIKDSGKLLPGHGGVLDRIDSLLAVLPMAAALYYLHDLFFVVAQAR